MSSLWAKTVAATKSAASTVADATKGTTDTIAFAYRHKTLNVTVGEEDASYKVPMERFLALRSCLVKVADDANKFLGAMRQMSFACSELGSGFYNLSMESDPPAVRKCAEAYRGVMGGIDEGVRKVPDERIVAEVVGSINNRVAEMDQIKKKIDERVNHKREYDYYVQKVRELKEKPSTDATKLPRSESKLAQNTTLLEQSTVELLNTFDLYERARPTLLKAEFEVLRSCQKQYFTGAASAMNMFVIVPEGKPGGGLSIEQIAAASGVAATPQSFTASRTGGTSVPTMDSSPYSSGGPVSAVAPPPVPEVPSRPIVCRAKMLYAFNGSSADELSAKVGDVINVYEKRPDQWWVGELNGRKGIFPGNYAEEIKGGVPALPSAPTRPSSSAAPSSDFSSMAINAGASYARENPDVAKKAMNAGINYAKENPDQVKNAAMAVAKNEQLRGAAIGFAKENPGLAKDAAKNAFNSGLF